MFDLESILKLGRANPDELVKGMSTEMLLSMARGQQSYPEHFEGSGIERAVTDELQRRGISATWGEA